MSYKDIFRNTYIFISIDNFIKKRRNVIKHLMMFLQNKNKNNRSKNPL